MANRYSFEFFPPKTEAGREKLVATRNELNSLAPDFFSVTYGAGGSTRDNTRGIVLDAKAAGIDVAPHLSFGGDEEEEVLALVEQYRQAGVRRIVALRGDIPSGMGATRLVYARELVEFIRKHTGDHFELEVAAYPEVHPDAPSYEQDVAYLKEKLDAGANSAITQYFFNADAYFYFLDACEKAGIDKPIYPGIMPITNYANLARFSRNCGAEIPRWLARKLDGYGQDLESIAAFGEEYVTEMCQILMEGGAPGIHFYTMNQVQPVKRMLESVKASHP
ncbi:MULTISPECIES: methylenetetrahydrofolate reductase [NAD(P)H] [Spongiibacter]|jgi:methylenetetrahydrofolate reductase (NADPH)|uniref:methylenetetrahydrofolate reductase [NAD(P)H] n=1 Tax=Spongiibacter TaxID=630749 RepID=UPI000C0A087F|nr:MULTISPECIES: methylenetetrahydrofolate reductase [NAD(P)H] [Spongiibacter]MAK44481.1 methylenetetrahydrofolate reductase [NAD(P)H] [Spongiibacter sp.]MBM7421796.1 methylenetetrahydrofolate reductase (NADPH) [Spongiibacter marinus]MEE2652381.1 methylenetetrahydrofolate reductase [NAD(P)H] [Pseudomonadota bacterium]|tara:strand:- start:1212 stop:2045 length:834 start_codon:yes stop_codon:yes gene_type:complete